MSGRFRATGSQRTRSSERTDVTVIGAGIVGLLTALGLAERGVDVVVLEADTVASGASGGLGERGVRANGRHPHELPLMARAHELWPDLGYQRTGQLHVTEREADMPALTEQAARQQAAGVTSEVIDGGAVRELEPNITDRVVGAVWCPSDGTVDHTATCLAVADDLRQRGVEIREHTAVERVEGNTVIAANGGAALLADVPTFDVYPQALFVRAAPLVRHLVGHHHRRAILKTLPSGDTMITGGWLGDAGNVVEDQVGGNLAEAVAVYPGLDGAELVRAVADRPEAVTGDFLPIIDHNDTVAVATGWSGHGFAIAPAVAELLAEWATTGAWSPLLEPFRVSRFGVDFNLA